MGAGKSLKTDEKKSGEEKSRTRRFLDFSSPEKAKMIDVKCQIIA